MGAMSFAMYSRILLYFEYFIVENQRMNGSITGVSLYEFSIREKSKQWTIKEKENNSCQD